MANSKQIGNFGAVCVIIGSLVGSGIFVAPTVVAQFSPSHVVAGSIWILGAIMCLCGGMIYSKLAQHFPESGGQYIYIRQMVSPALAAVYGWMSFLLIGPLMIGGSALFFGEQMKFLYPNISPLAVKATGIALVFAFTYLNHRGIEIAGRLQGALVVLLIATLFIVTGASYFTLDTAVQSVNIGTKTPSFDANSVNKGLLALAMVLWAFEGFNSATFITGEIKDGARQIQKIVLRALAIVTASYFAFVFTVYRYIPYQDLIVSSNVGTDLASLSFGSYAGTVVFVLTCLGIVTTIHTSIMIGPRITRSLAADGLCWAKLSRIHPMYGSPSLALWMQMIMASVCLFAGSFQSLISLFVVVNWFFYGITAWGSVSLASQRNFFDRSIVFMFIVGVIALLSFQLISQPGFTVSGLGFVWVLYFGLKRFFVGEGAVKNGSPERTLV